MKQMPSEGLQIIPIDFQSHTTPESVKEFRPTVYQDGTAVCVVLGPDPVLGVFGCGDTTEEALQDWDHSLQERIKHPFPEDETIQYVKDHLAASKRNVW